MISERIMLQNFNTLAKNSAANSSVVAATFSGAATYPTASSYKNADKLKNVTSSIFGNMSAESLNLNSKIEHNDSDSLSNLSTSNINHTNHSSIQHQTQIGNNHVKRERQSPSTNGELQATISRSRSATPLSLRSTPPQAPHNATQEAHLPMHGLPGSLLNSMHQAQLPTESRNAALGSSAAVSGIAADFPTRNYSDFMRSLAAKYNNSNPNDGNATRRNAYANISSTPVPSNSKVPVTSKPTPNTATSSLKKESTNVTQATTRPSSMSPTDATSSSLKSQSAQCQLSAACAAAAAVSVSPFMTSLLSSLYSPSVMQPIFDMSSTQALITLAHAAKESEIRSAQKANENSERTQNNVSLSPSPSLNIVLQQAAQFASPALIYSGQLQEAHSQAVRQSSPLHTRANARVIATNANSIGGNIGNSNNNSDNTNSNNASANDKSVGTTAPLDLSAQPPAAKRFKAESTSSRSSTEGISTRRISSASTSPSPPLSDKGSVPGSSTTYNDETTTTATTTILSTTKAKGSVTCQAQSAEVNSWTVDDVCAFVGSIDICACYVQSFRDQCIDGTGLPLLTEDHLMNSLGMKLGPALKLRSMLAKKLGGPCPCVACVAQAQHILALQSSTSAAGTPGANIGSSNGGGNNTGSSNNIAIIGGCHIATTSTLTASNINTPTTTTTTNAVSTNFIGAAKQLDNGANHFLTNSKKIADDSSDNNSNTNGDFISNVSSNSNSNSNNNNNNNNINNTNNNNIKLKRPGSADSGGTLYENN
ncbi:myosin-G heavy chain [Teleopsis dalmanni]|uniref:myosin-G heavy chain n=1 Tax=Teleopsis dalmanni TaxID=139649 RepID=UPI0018CD125B|nr:myosin-G heavy chain [Teleopsis dalmanni]